MMSSPQPPSTPPTSPTPLQEEEMDQPKPPMPQHGHNTRSKGTNKAHVFVPAKRKKDSTMQRSGPAAVSGTDPTSPQKEKVVSPPKTAQDNDSHAKTRPGTTTWHSKNTRRTMTGAWNDKTLSAETHYANLADTSAAFTILQKKSSLYVKPPTLLPSSLVGKNLLFQQSTLIRIAPRDTFSSPHCLPGTSPLCQLACNTCGIVTRVGPFLGCSAKHHMCYYCRQDKGICRICGDSQIDTNMPALDKVLMQQVLNSARRWPCSFTPLGCKERASYQNIGDHELLCTKQPAVCPNNNNTGGPCLWAGLLEDLDRHLLTSSCADIAPYHAGEDVFVGAILDHTKRPVLKDGGDHLWPPVLLVSYKYSILHPMAHFHWDSSSQTAAFFVSTHLDPSICPNIRVRLTLLSGEYEHSKRLKIRRSDMASHIRHIAPTLDLALMPDLTKGVSFTRPMKPRDFDQHIKLGLYESKRIIDKCKAKTTPPQENPEPAGGPSQDKEQPDSYCQYPNMTDKEREEVSKAAEILISMCRTRQEGAMPAAPDRDPNCGPLVVTVDSSHLDSLISRPPSGHNGIPYLVAYGKLTHRILADQPITAHSGAIIHLPRRVLESFKYENVLACFRIEFFPAQ